MSLKLILVFPVAAAIACYAIRSTAAQSDSETLHTTVNFDQVFADVEAAAANFDPVVGNFTTAQALQGCPKKDKRDHLRRIVERDLKRK